MLARRFSFQPMSSLQIFGIETTLRSGLNAFSSGKSVTIIIFYSLTATFGCFASAGFESGVKLFEVFRFVYRTLGKKIVFSVNASCSV